MGDEVREPTASNDRDARLLAVISEVRELGGEAYQSATEGQIGYRKPVQEDTIALLTSITQLAQPQDMLEFGTAYGLSGLQLLRGNPDGKLHTLEFDPTVARTAQGFFDRAGVRAHVYPEGSDTFIGALERLDVGPRYDLVIFDHDKEAYLPDLKRVERFLRPGAIVLMDNVTDKRERCGDAADYALAKWGGHVLNTAAGLYMGQLPR